MVLRRIETPPPSSSVTTSDTGIENDGLATGYWAGIRMGDDVPVTYFQIVSNRHTQQENITVFPFAENMEGGSSKWWYFTECQHFSLYPPQPEPVPVEIQWTRLAIRGISQFDVTGAGEWPCTMQVSSDLNNWESLATTVRAGGLLQFADSATNSPPLRFYRLRAEN